MTLSPAMQIPNPCAPRAAKVAIVGPGKVGMTTAYALLMSAAAAEIVLVGRDRLRLEARVQDLRDAVMYSHPARVSPGELADCAAADVIIICAGVSQTPDMVSRLDDLQGAAAILREIIGELARYGAAGIILIASNPVDLMTYAALRWSGLPANRVMGSGTTLDTSRLRWRLGERYGVTPADVQASVLGEHGDSQVAVLSSARIGGAPLAEFCRQRGLPYDERALRKIAADTRTAGLEIVRKTGATHYGVSTALARIVTAILHDEHAVLTVSTLAPEELGLGQVCLSLPAVIHREGVAALLPISVDEEESRALRGSADVLKRHLAALDFSDLTPRRAAGARLAVA